MLLLLLSTCLHFSLLLLSPQPTSDVVVGALYGIEMLQFTSLIWCINFHFAKRDSHSGIRSRNASKQSKSPDTSISIISSYTDNDNDNDNENNMYTFS